MPFTVGENVGPYRIVEQLGQGGMATVYKAYHAALDRYVAIKVLHPAFGEDPSFEARFQREARVVAKLEHRNIVPIYDYAEHEKRPYLVMKYIEGKTLKAKLNEDHLSSADILKIVKAVGSALAYAHQRDVLHRDIKPSNVLVADDGQIYLADFGLARIAQLGESTLSGDMIIGTPQYISPEQAMGLRDLDARTDLYSFGVMIYEMVVGKVPFNADTPFSVIHDHIYSPLPLPRIVNPNVPDEVERVLLKALAKERADRYESAEQLIAAFREAWTRADVQNSTDSPVAAGAPATAQAAQQVSAVAEVPQVMPPTHADQVASPAAKPVKKKKFPWVGVGVALIMLCCITYTANAVRTHANPAFGGLRGDGGSQQSTSEPAADGKLPKDVASALEDANTNPGDADLQLTLAAAYWDANMPDATYETLRQMAKLVGPGDTAFYTDAAEEFTSRDAWLPSALLYFEAVRTYKSNESIPQELRVPFHEAVYKSSERYDASQALPFDEIAKVDEPISLIAQARFAYYSKDAAKAYELLEQAKKLDPSMHEAILLEAELNAMDGRPERAGLLVGLLATDSTVPGWIQTFAEYIITERLK